MALAIGLGLLPCQAVAEDFCATLPTCEELGYTHNETLCANQAVMRCPFDNTKIFCNIKNVKKCEFGDIVYTSNMCFSKDPIGEPKGIVIHPVHRIALALEYASDTPVPLMTPSELQQLYDAGAFNPYSSYYADADDFDNELNVSPLVLKFKYNTFTGYITGPSAAATQNILDDNPNYKPFPIKMNAEKLCEGEWFLPPIGAFYGGSISSDDWNRYKENNNKFFPAEASKNYPTHEGKQLYLWTSSFYYYSEKFPSMIAVILPEADDTIYHFPLHYSSSVTLDFVKNFLQDLTTYGNNFYNHLMVRCATRY